MKGPVFTQHSKRQNDEVIFRMSLLVYSDSLKQIKKTPAATIAAKGKKYLWQRGGVFNKSKWSVSLYLLTENKKACSLFVLVETKKHLRQRMR